MAENHAGSSCGAAANHVLIRTADVGGDYLEDDAVIDLLPGWVFQFGVVDRLHFNVIWAEKDDPSIGRHKDSLSAPSDRVRLSLR